VAEPDALTVAESYAVTVAEPDALTVAESYAVTVAESYALTVAEPDALTVAESYAVTVAEPDALTLSHTPRSERISIQSTLSAIARSSSACVLTMRSDIAILVSNLVVLNRPPSPAGDSLVWDHPSPLQLGEGRGLGGAAALEWLADLAELEPVRGGCSDERTALALSPVPRDYAPSQALAVGAVNGVESRSTADEFGAHVDPAHDLIHFVRINATPIVVDSQIHQPWTSIWTAMSAQRARKVMRGLRL
jgi:hypothetical protein